MQINKTYCYSLTKLSKFDKLTKLLNLSDLGYPVSFIIQQGKAIYNNATRPKLDYKKELSEQELLIITQNYNEKAKTGL